MPDQYKSRKGTQTFSGVS